MSDSNMEYFPPVNNLPHSTAIVLSAIDLTLWSGNGLTGLGCRSIMHKILNSYPKLTTKNGQLYYTKNYIHFTAKVSSPAKSCQTGCFFLQHSPHLRLLLPEGVSRVASSLAPPRWPSPSLVPWTSRPWCSEVSAPSSSWPLVSANEIHC